MAESSTAICNMAITLVGGNRIVNMEDESEEAILCNIFFTQVRDVVLEKFRWAFAQHRVALAQLDDTPITEDYEYYYQLPNDCIIVLGLPDNPEADFRIEADRLLCNLESVNIHYVRQIDVSTKYTAHFVQAFYTLLAAELAGKLKHSRVKRRELLEDFYTILHEATCIEGKGNKPDDSDEYTVAEAGRA